MSESAKRYEENSNMIKEIRASTDVLVRNQGVLIKTLEIQIGKISKEKSPRGLSHLPCYIINVCFDNALADLGASVSVMPLSTYLNLDFIILDMPEDVKMPLILERPILSTAHAKIDVFKRKITLRVEDEKVIFKSVKPATSLIKMVYILSLRERIELDLELRRDQVDDLMPTIEEGEVIEEFRARIDARMVSKNFRYPSDYDHDKKGEAMLFLRRTVFTRSWDVNARRFEGMITIYKGNEEVTCQMMRSHPRFKRHTNEQCNKIPPLLKVSEEDKMNGISHSYQKLKSFYKEVLNLGSEYVRDAKMKEWLTRGHISVHEME
ncbi:hypothetical protein Tco_1359242 [Tanacetum coccineum]